MNDIKSSTIAWTITKNEGWKTMFVITVLKDDGTVFYTESFAVLEPVTVTNLAAKTKYTILIQVNVIEDSSCVHMVNFTTSTLPGE